MGGTSTDAIYFGGYKPAGIEANTESWDGSSWTEVNDLNTARAQLAGAGDASPSVLAFGGGPTSSGVANTESWNGASWVEVADLATARYLLAGAGSSNTSALAFGGYPKQNHTEEWSGSTTTIKVLSD